MAEAQSIEPDEQTRWSWRLGEVAARDDHGGIMLRTAHGDQLVGLLTMENVSELLMIRAALRSAPRPPAGTARPLFARRLAQQP